MTPTSSNRPLRALLVVSACVVALAFGLWGVERGLAATLGVVLSVLNWLALRWLTGRLVATHEASKGGASLLLIAKMGVLMALVYILIQRLHVDPVGLAFGLGVLFIGPVLTGLFGGGESNKGGEPRSAALTQEER